MPGLDVSFMVTDPMFADTFTIRRRLQTVSDKGRAINSSSDVPDLWGVVTQREPSDLERERDGDAVFSRITVCTQEPLYSAINGQAPDVVVWNGMSYLVEEVLPYSRFGAGVYEAKCKSMTAPQEAQ